MSGRVWVATKLNLNSTVYCVNILKSGMVPGTYLQTGS